MTKIVIAYHSGYGHTERQAQAVAEGVKAVPGASVRLVQVSAITEEDWVALDAADGIVFGAPTYMGSASAPFKTFMDASSKAWFTQNWKNKFAAGFTCSASQNGDKLFTLQQLFIFAMQHGMLWAGLGLMPGNNNSAGSVNDLNRLGAFSGAMAQANADQGAEAMLESDLATARVLGQRVAEAAAPRGAAGA
mgnify:CR=1 FL=1